MEVERNIVRILGTDLNGYLPLWRALTRIKGIGHNFAWAVNVVVSEKTGLDFNTPLGAYPEKYDKLIEEVIRDPLKHGIPAWMLNTRKEWKTGKDMHLVNVDLEEKEREVLKRMAGIKSYRGLRRMWGLKVRGQRTRSTGRKNKRMVLKKKKKG